MSTVKSEFISVSCDGPKCTKSITFPATKEAHAEAFQSNPWLNTLREVTAPGGRQFAYCSDECEAEGLSTGVHNPARPKLVEGNAHNIALAAQAADQARKATAALRQGAPITI